MRSKQRGLLCSDDDVRAEELEGRRFRGWCTWNNALLVSGLDWHPWSLVHGCGCVCVSPGRVLQLRVVPRSTSPHVLAFFCHTYRPTCPSQVGHQLIVTSCQSPSKSTWATPITKVVDEHKRPCCTGHIIAKTRKTRWGGPPSRQNS